MRKNPRRILSPQRLPFRHPGKLYVIKYLGYYSFSTVFQDCPKFVQFFLLPLRDLDPK
jgi:hypothetical protein